MRQSVGEHSMVATDLLRGLPEAFVRAQKNAREKFVCWDRLKESVMPWNRAGKRSFKAASRVGNAEGFEPRWSPFMISPVKVHRG